MKIVRVKSTYSKVWPRHLLIGIANPGLTGNCISWKGRIESNGDKVIRGKNTSFPECFPVMMFASMMRRPRLITASLVPFRSPSFGSKFRMSIIGEYFFKNKEWANQRESRNSEILLDEKITILLDIWMFAKGLEHCMHLNKLRSYLIWSLLLLIW